MKLHLVDPSTINSKTAEISRIGAAVNDSNLFSRIQEACLSKQVFLFMSKDGFVVLKPVTGPGVLIWVAYSAKKTDRLSYLYELERFAHDINAKHLTFWSNRKGFQKIIPQFGFIARPAKWMDRPIT